MSQNYDMPPQSDRSKPLKISQVIYGIHILASITLIAFASLYFTGSMVDKKSVRLGLMIITLFEASLSTLLSIYGYGLTTGTFSLTGGGVVGDDGY